MAPVKEDVILLLGLWLYADICLGLLHARCCCSCRSAECSQISEHGRMLRHAGVEILVEERVL